mmetsp:Transcript_14040/g.40434  ORF Transcript_14040/g.40434 Transcript_14040/m.40434 type:complete len:150 (-) Transcript_14040:197-646(-)
MYFVSRELVEQIANSSVVQAGMDAAIGSAASGLPWEDVFTGYSLSEVAQGQNLAFVHMGEVAFSESGRTHYSHGVRSTSLVYHDKSLARLRGHHAWSTAHECRTEASQIRIACDDGPHVACNNATWRRCYYIHNGTRCPPERAGARRHS